jgi:hypothetical protein
MKGKLKKSLIAILTLALTFTSAMSYNSITVLAASASAITINEKLSNEQLAITPGETKHMRIPIRALGSAIIDPSVVVSATNAPFTLSQATLTRADQSTIDFISTLGSTYVDFDIEVKETAKIGTYPITIKVTASVIDLDGTVSALELSTSIDVQIVKEASPAQLVIDKVSIKDAFISSKTNISFYVRNEGEIIARNTYVTLDYGTTNIIADYVTPKIKVGDLEPGKEEFFSLPIKILSTATVGLKTVGVTFDYKDVDGTKCTDTNQIYIDVKKNENAPELLADKLSYSKELKPGAEVVMKLLLHNYGSMDASNITIKVDDATTGTDGFLKNYLTDSVYVGSVDKDKNVEARIPLLVSKAATSGNKKLNLILNFDDEKGNNFTSTITVNPEVIGGSASGDSGLVIENVKQIPEQPVAGDSMQVSFHLKNKSQSDITEIKLSLQNLDGSTFIPKESEPYIYVDKIAAGKSKKITMNLTVSDKIPEGLNNLSVKYTYAGNATGETVTIPVRDVKNDLGSGSKPKLIIGNFSVDKDELRAGSTFNLTLDIYNTHSSVAAKNITVTLTQADNIFTVTQGSNSFFIPNINAGEQVEKTINMKVKADATTKAYPIKVVIEYEYEGIKPNPETGEVGVTRNEELNLQAIENARPELNNINIYSWDGNVVVGGTATLGFEFYNLGKSQLNNVTISVGGDFTKTDGDVKFIGNVAAGTPYYDEFEVTPNVEGTAKAILTVTFEDSNGDEVKFTKEYTTQVMPPLDMNSTMPDPNSMGAFNPMPLAKKPILPVWGFILLEIALAAIFVPVTRKVVITVYKAKLRKLENEQI